LARKHECRDAERGIPGAGTAICAAAFQEWRRAGACPLFEIPLDVFDRDRGVIY